MLRSALVNAPTGLPSTSTAIASTAAEVSTHPFASSALSSTQSSSTMCTRLYKAGFPKRK